MEDDAWIEAWIRRKPRRIIHNQNLIELFLALAIAAPFPLAGLSFWLIFGLYPTVVVPIVLIVWFVLFVSYSALKLHGVSRKRKNR